MQNNESIQKMFWQDVNHHIIANGFWNLALVHCVRILVQIIYLCHPSSLVPSRAQQWLWALLLSWAVLAPALPSKTDLSFQVNKTAGRSCRQGFEGEGKKEFVSQCTHYFSNRSENCNGKAVSLLQKMNGKDVHKEAQTLLIFSLPWDLKARAGRASLSHLSLPETAQFQSYRANCTHQAFFSPVNAFQQCPPWTKMSMTINQPRKDK